MADPAPSTVRFARQLLELIDAGNDTPGKLIAATGAHPRLVDKALAELKRTGQAEKHRDPGQSRHHWRRVAR